MGIVMKYFTYYEMLKEKYDCTKSFSYHLSVCNCLKMFSPCNRIKTQNMITNNHIKKNDNIQSLQLYNLIRNVIVVKKVLLNKRNNFIGIILLF